MQQTEKKINIESAPIGPIILKDIERRSENMPENSGREIPNRLDENKGSGMQKTESEMPQNLLNTEKAVIPHGASTLPTASLKEAKSQSMNLALDTMMHLNGLMKGLTKNDPPNNIQLNSVERVFAACACGKTINEIMKTQLDAFKLMKEE